MKAISESLRNVREDRRSIYKKLKRSINVEMNLLLRSKKEMQQYTTN
jgi:ssDNA-specific exonuclease RecJ